jgi:hypothetical protein
MQNFLTFVSSRRTPRKARFSPRKACGEEDWRPTGESARTAPLLSVVFGHFQQRQFARAADIYMQHMQSFCGSKAPHKDPSDIKNWHNKANEDAMCHFENRRKKGGEKFSATFKEQLKNFIKDALDDFVKQNENKKNAIQELVFAAIAGTVTGASAIVVGAAMLAVKWAGRRKIYLKKKKYNFDYKIRFIKNYDIFYYFYKF